MSDHAQPSASPSALEPAQPLQPSEPPPAWQPPPREWTWRDLFTAPMLAFKPKCMVVSAVTLLAIGLVLALFYEPLGDRQMSFHAQLWTDADTKWVHHLSAWGVWAVVLMLAGLGGTFVATVIKADLLDDEFLTWKEAWERFIERALPAVLVPLFLLVLASGFWLLLWLGGLVASIPYVGSTIYALLYPLAFLFGLLAVLVSIACLLGLFLVPGIVAARKHGWFDNVVDTIEAVGTKPHLLAAGLALTVAMAWLAYTIGSAGQGALYRMSKELPYSGPGGSNQITLSEEVGKTRQDMWLHLVDARRWGTNLLGSPWDRDSGSDIELQINAVRIDSKPGYVKWWSGLVVGIWKTVIAALIMGFAFNLILAGGLLTYLWVREDDYWDEEDLQDLDKLAAELEEEAKRESDAAAAQHPSHAPGPVSTPTG